MTNATATAVKMLEALPVDLQERVLDRLQRIVAEVQDEYRWTRCITRKRVGLRRTARRVRLAAQRGHTAPWDDDRL